MDTGPVQERVYAQYAGLGWIGKNTCLINPELGSWLFLGEIICTLPLEPDTQGLEQCGSCTRCLEACPTGALVEPGVLDSNALPVVSDDRAARGDSRAEYRAGASGTHVYGCDICQEVCPYNQPPPTSGDAAWQPRAGLDLPRWSICGAGPTTSCARSSKGSADDAREARRACAATSPWRSATAATLTRSRRSTSRSDDRPSATDEMVLEHIRWARRAARIDLMSRRLV